MLSLLVAGIRYSGYKVYGDGKERLNKDGSGFGTANNSNFHKSYSMFSVLIILHMAWETEHFTLFSFYHIHLSILYCLYQHYLC